MEQGCPPQNHSPLGPLSPQADLAMRLSAARESCCRRLLSSSVRYSMDCCELSRGRAAAR